VAAGEVDAATPAAEAAEAIPATPAEAKKSKSQWKEVVTELSEEEVAEQLRRLRNVYDAYLKLVCTSPTLRLPLCLPHRLHSTVFSVSHCPLLGGGCSQEAFSEPADTPPPDWTVDAEGRKRIKPPPPLWVRQPTAPVGLTRYGVALILRDADVLDNQLGFDTVETLFLSALEQPVQVGIALT
jgi:hypothetical protein